MEDKRTTIQDAEDTGNWTYDSGPMKMDWEVKPLDNDFEIEYTYEYAEPEVEWPVGELTTPVNNWEDAQELKLYYEEANQMLAEFTGDRHFVLYNDEGEMLIDCDLSDGFTVFGPNYTPDEATRVFWETIGKVDVQPMTAPPGIADDVPEEYTNPLAGWTLEEETCEGEVNEDCINKIVKEIQSNHFDKTMKGLIDG